MKTDLRLASEKELFVIRDEYLQTDIEQLIREKGCIREYEHH